MERLNVILEREIEAYSGEAENGYVFVTSNSEKTRFVVTGVATAQGKRIVNNALVVQLLGDKVIIEEDKNSKILLDALLQAGVPRDQIILAYAGEPVPETEW
jgi:hypothetical protein